MALTNRDHALLWVLVALLISAGAWFVWLTPTATAIHSTRGTVQALTQEKQLLTNRTAFLNATERDLTTRGDDERLLTIAAPADGGVAELVTTFDAMATDAGVVLSSLQPQTGAASTDQLLMSVNVTGTFRAVQAFVTAIERNLRPLVVENLTLSSTSSFEGSTLVTATLTVGALVATPSASPSGATQ